MVFFLDSEVLLFGTQVVGLSTFCVALSGILAVRHGAVGMVQWYFCLMFLVMITVASAYR